MDPSQGKGVVKSKIAHTKRLRQFFAHLLILTNFTYILFDVILAAVGWLVGWLVFMAYQHL